MITSLRVNLIFIAPMFIKKLPTPSKISEGDSLEMKCTGHAVSMINVDQYRSMPDQVSGIDTKYSSININTLNFICH